MIPRRIQEQTWILNYHYHHFNFPSLAAHLLLLLSILLLLSSLLTGRTAIINFTCLPNFYIEFITKRFKCCYKVGQVLQSTTQEIRQVYKSNRTKS